MNCPSIIQIDSLERDLKENCDMSSAQHPTKGEVWVPARTIGYYSLRNRLKATWLVFTGEADALLWRGQ